VAVQHGGSGVTSETHDLSDETTEIVINGKFLSAEPTGVHRVAEELIRHAFQIVDADKKISARIKLELWVPSDATANADKLQIPYRVVGPLTGIPWEQLTLPLKARGRTILSLCNVGPVASSNAVTMFHDAQVHNAPDSYRRLFRYWYKFHQPLSGKRHQKILTVSDFSREQLHNYGIARRDRVSVILNGVDHVLKTVPDESIIERLDLTPQKFVVALANVQPHKNIGLLLRIFARAEMSDMPLVLFGGAGKDAFVNAGHTVPDNIIFAGRVSDSELRALYASALCLAFPSRTEGFGLPPLEAMTTGCPAIVAPEGALPQVCGQAAVYAGVDDEEGWLRAIVSLRDRSSDYDKLRKASLAQSELFTWKRAATQLVDQLLAL
jgi:glycosyltransferase involved in cell wall biosynthesis